MADRNLSYLDYVKAAYHLRAPLGPLGELPLNKLLLGGLAVLGVAHPGFWLLGLAWEAGYLLYLPGSPRFQKLVAGRQLLVSRAPSPAAPDLSLVESLNGTSARRFQALREQCARLSVDRPHSTLDDLTAGRVQDLLLVFAKLLLSEERLTRTLQESSEADLTKDIAALQRRAAGATDEILKHSLTQSCEIQQRRLENLKKATQNLEVVQAELERIERQVSLLIEEGQIGTDPAAFSARLDTVTTTLQETNRWMTENSDLLSSLGRTGTRQSQSE